MIWLITSMATASPGSAGAVHLGAQPLAEGTSYAGVGGGTLWTLGGIGLAPIVEAGTALSDRTAISAMAALTFPNEVAPVLLSTRWLAVDQPDQRLSLGLSATFIPWLRDPGLGIHLTPVIGLESGDRLRADLTVPIWGLSSYNQYFGIERFPVPALVSAGVSGLIGEHHRLRFGWPEMLSWHYRNEHVYVDVGGMYILFVGSLWAKVGVIF